MKNAIRFGVLTAAAWTFGFVAQQPALAQHDHGGGGMSMPSPSVPAVRTGKLTGTLIARDENSIKVDTKQKGSATYMVDAKTIFKGDAQPGSEVTIKYQEQGGMQRATTVEAKKTKAKRSS